MAMSTLLVVSAVCLIFGIFALALALTDRSTTRWLREEDGNRATTRAAHPDKNGR
ncbi:cell division protein FtsX [Bradyrhizobium sp. USDA 3240]